MISSYVSKGAHLLCDIVFVIRCYAIGSVYYRDHYHFDRAAYCGYYHSVKLLADVNRDYLDYAFISACYAGHQDVVELLHGLGADVSTHSYLGLKYAAGQGHIEVVRYIVQASQYELAAVERAFLRAIIHNQAIVTQYLYPYLSAHRDVLDLGLICACQHGTYDMVKWLYQTAGANIHPDLWSVNPKIQKFLASKHYLHRQPALMRLAAKIYVQHYAMPEPDIIPDSVRQILACAAD